MGNVSIKSMISAFGYNDKRLNEGKSLYARASELHDMQKKEYGDQFAATDALDKALNDANALYMRHVKLARIALKGERGAAQSLDLDGRRKQTYSGWIAQASVFYTNALADNSVKSALAKFGINQAALKDGQSLVKDVETKLAIQLKEKGEAQDATKARDTALEDLLDWISDFRAVSRIALESQPQLLEILGIVEPS